MKAGSMEGLVGASRNIKMIDTPMRIYQEAERRGDTETMDRAMGYAGDYASKAEEYRKMAEEELPKELEEERAEFEERMKARTEQKQMITELDGIKMEISEEGKMLSTKQNDKNIEIITGSINVSRGTGAEAETDLADHKITMDLLHK